MVLFIHAIKYIKMIKGATDQNGDLNGTCEQGLNYKRLDHSVPPIS